MSISSRIKNCNKNKDIESAFGIMTSHFGSFFHLESFVIWFLSMFNIATPVIPMRENNPFVGCFVLIKQG